MAKNDGMDAFGALVGLGILVQYWMVSVMQTQSEE